MRLYLDDDSVSRALIGLLRNAGHDVQRPADVSLSGADDVLHLSEAARANRVLLSRNQDDFRNLHALVQIVQGHYPGILIVRKDNDPRRDMAPVDIVRAIGKLLNAGIPVADQFHILNHWR
jgi:predicted nuclease of predicted toxin-antitoxin system